MFAIKVLKVMEKHQADLPAPFPIANQHVRSVLQARSDKGLPQEDSDPEESAPTSKPAEGSSEKVTEKKGCWNYSEIRNDFINQSKKRGCSYLVAKAQWDLSAEKRAFLGKESIQELKKRRFLAKGATHNPWA